MRRLLLGVVACAVLVVACGGDDDPTPPATTAPTTASTTTSTTSTTTATTTTAPGPRYLKAKVDPTLPRQDIDVDVRYPADFTPEQVAVVTAWANDRHVFHVVVDPPDPDSPLVGRYVTPEVARANREGLRRRRDRGEKATLPTNTRLHETVTEVVLEADSAWLRTCQVDDGLIVRMSDGGIVNSDVVTRTFRVFVSRIGGRWLVSPPRADQHAQWDGVQEARCLS